MGKEDDGGSGERQNEERGSYASAIQRPSPTVIYIYRLRRSKRSWV